MALVNHAKKEINAKIVYFGAAGSGKSTALSYIYSRIKASLRGELRKVPAGSDNLLFFDFSPFDAPLPNGYHVRIHVYTLSGAVTNPATWKMTLKGADGIMILANPTDDHTAETKECVAQLRDFLSGYGVGLHETPVMLLLNNFTCENRSDPMVIANSVDLPNIPCTHINAASGEGLLEALANLSRLVLDRVSVQHDKPETEAADTTDREYDSGESDEQGSFTASEMPCGAEQLQIDLQNQQVASDGTTIKIPLVITQGDITRKIIVTVNVELE